MEAVLLAAKSRAAYISDRPCFCIPPRAEALSTPPALPRLSETPGNSIPKNSIALSINFVHYFQFTARKSVIICDFSSPRFRCVNNLLIFGLNNAIMLNVYVFGSRQCVVI